MVVVGSRRTWAGAVVAAALLLPVGACSDPKVEEAPPPPREDGDTLVASIDEHIGLDVDSDRVRAVLVHVDGKPVVEQYRDSSAADHWDLQWATTSVVSILVGIAIDEGRIDGVDETLAELLPEHAPTMSRDAAGTTLRELLTMSAGFPGLGSDPVLPAMAAKDPAGRLLASLPPSPPARFQYSHTGAHLVATVLARATGMSVLDYAREKLFDPLGIKTRPVMDDLAVDANIPAYNDAGFAWPVDRSGTNLGWSVLKLRPADMMRIGELMLNEGEYDGHRIVSAEWVRESTSPHVDTADTLAKSYGYEWWVSTIEREPAYFALGFGGQYIGVLPEQDAVVVVSTEIDLKGGATEGIGMETAIGLMAYVVAPYLESEDAP